jgi:L-amino acid N-acyltransferase YncA
MATFRRSRPAAPRPNTEPVAAVTSDLIIRDARAEDAGALLEIYRPFITETAVSFELEPPSVEEFAGRIASAQSKWAWLVAETNGGIAGYAYASAFRSRAAYRFTAETSAYAHPAHRGKGVARALYQRLFEILIEKGFANAYAGIALPNHASVAFHQAMGFTYVGTFHRAGWKFGRWHDVSWWERKLREEPVEGP